MLIVVALGGNALLRRGEPTDAQTQRRNVAVAADALAELARDHSLVITHGNGPQIGLLALESGSAESSEPYPLDVLGAESEGMIGYLLQQALRARLPERQVATLLTQVIVDADDPAFAHPSKPIGAVYDWQTAQRIASERDWNIVPDGEGYRRVVPSPEPREIVELQTIRTLVGAGVLVVCVGGGGIPVVADTDGALYGVGAVIDKDHSAALLARELEADALLLLTDVVCVQRGYGTVQAKPIHETFADELDPAQFPEGSMRPKVEAAREFVRQSGKLAGIGALADAVQILEGTRGTRVHLRTSAPQTERDPPRLRGRATHLDDDAPVERLARHAHIPACSDRTRPSRSTR